MQSREKKREIEFRTLPYNLEYTRILSYETMYKNYNQLYSRYDDGHTFRNAGAAKNHVIRILFIYFEQGVSFLDQAIITFQNVNRKYC